jgi:uncharacterized delta-60 repeat protein
MTSRLIAILSFLAAFGSIADAAGDLDSSFVSPSLSVATKTVIQPNGKVIAVGRFAASASLPSGGVMRFNADGSVDPSFVGAPGTSGLVMCVALQADGMIIIGGGFTSVHGVARNGIARLNADGTLDSSYPVGSGPNKPYGLTDEFRWIHAMALQPDGKLLVGGDFTNWSGVPRLGLARVNTDGSLDTTLPSLASAIKGYGADVVRAVAVQPSATAPHFKILIGGKIEGRWGGGFHFGIMRFHADGTRDTSFVNVNGTHKAASNDIGLVSHILPMPSGKIAIGGEFSKYDGITANNIAMLNTNGSKDSSFAARQSILFDMDIQSDGKLLVAGSGGPKRLNTNGSTDSAFSVPAVGGDYYMDVTVDQAAKVMVGAYASSGRPRLRRLNNDAASGGIVAISAATAAVTEGNSVQLMVQRTGGSAGAISVNYSTINGSAFAPIDFPVQTGTLTWADGDTADKSITINVPTDNMLENTETMKVSLGGLVGSCHLGAISVADITITDGDVGSTFPTALFATATSAAIEAVGTVVTVDVTLSAIATVQATVPFTISGTTTAADYTTTAASPLVFAIGESTKQISFTLNNDGAAEAPETIIVTLGQPTNAVIQASLASHTITITDDESAPTYTTQPTHVLATVGQPIASFAAVVAGAPTPTLQWARNSKAITGATDSTVSLGNIKLADVGTFNVTAKNIHGTLKSADAELAAVQLTAPHYVLPVNGAVTMTPITAGKGLSYEWIKVGNSQVLASTKAFVLKPLLQSQSGDYRCRISNAAGAYIDIIATLSVFNGPPVLINLPISNTLPSSIVSESYSYQFGSQHIDATAHATYPQKYLATGLPPGLKMDAVTGLISGKPTAARPTAAAPTPYSVKITVSNSKGSNSVTLGLTVAPISPTLVGRWNGYIARHSSNAQLGGRVDISVTPTGSFSGTITFGGTTYKLKSALNTNTTNANAGFVLYAVHLGIPTTISITMNAEVLGGHIDNGTQAMVTGWRNPFSKTAPLSGALLGYHTFGITPTVTAGDTTKPQGLGYGSFKVDTLGKLTVAGKLADGTSYSSACGTNAAGEILVFKSLYTNRGSVLGSLDITPGATFVDNTVEGDLSWTRQAITGRLYATGFTELALSARGAGYLPPLAPLVAMNLTDAGTNNAHMTFTEGGWLTDPLAAIRIKSGGTTVQPAVTATQKTTLTIAPTTGLFSGDLLVTAVNPATTLATARSAKHYGIIAKQLGVLKGGGFFVIPQMPTVGQTTSTSPQLSGAVKIEAGP